MKAELDKFVFAELFTDIYDDPVSEENQKVQLQRFGTTKLPLYAILTPEGKVVAETGGVQVGRDEFLKFVKEGHAAALAGAVPAATPTPAPTPKPTTSKAHGNTIDDLAAAEAESKKTGKPLLVEFTGEN